MPEKIRRCWVKELQPGMKLFEDVVYANGMTLLPQDTVLTPYFIERLECWGIDKVVISDGETIDSLPTTGDPIFEHSYNETLATAELIFNEIRDGGKLPLRECLRAVDILLDELVHCCGVMTKLCQVRRSDLYTFNHSVNVGVIATLIGMWMGIKDKPLRELALAGLLHDIGKAKVPLEILNKPGKLTTEEFDEIKKHSRLGYDIVKDTPEINADMALAVLQHHEREDGSGYPCGSLGCQITRFGKVIAVADIYDAMTSNRCYRPKFSPYRVAEMLAENTFGQLDPAVTTTFLHNITNHFVGKIVKLNTGEIGEVIYINPTFPTRPIVKVGDRFVNLMEKPDIIVDDDVM